MHWSFIERELEREGKMKSNGLPLHFPADPFTALQPSRSRGSPNSLSI